jgi:hypothetical protein
MTPICSAALAATVMLALHAPGAAAQSPAEPALATVALASSPSRLSVDELVRLHVAVTSLMTHPTPDALATIQEIQALMIARLETATPVSSGPAARN